MDLVTNATQFNVPTTPLALSSVLLNSTEKKKLLTCIISPNCTYLNYTDISNNTWLNYSNGDNLSESSSPNVLFQLVIQCVLCLCILGGNLLILAVVYVSNDMKRVTCYFVSNLAVSDLCFGIGLALRGAIAIIKPSSMYPCRIVISLAVTSGLTSLFGILFLCWQTYLAVIKMVSFHEALTIQNAKVLITGSWCIAIIIGALNTKFTDDIPETDAATKACFFGSGYTDRGYLLSITVIIFIIFLLVLYTQVITLIVLSRRRKMIVPAVIPSQTRSHQLPVPTSQNNQISTTSQLRRDAKRRNMPLRQGSVNEITLQVPLHNGNSDNNILSQPYDRPAKHSLFSSGITAKRRNDPVLIKIGSSHGRESGSTAAGIFGRTFTSKSTRPLSNHTDTDNETLRTIRHYHQTSRMTRANKRVMKIITYILVVFILCWFPYMIGLFLYAISPHHNGINSGNLSALVTFSIFQSFSNFIIYFIKDSTFKNRVKQICSMGNLLSFRNKVGQVQTTDKAGIFAVPVRKLNREVKMEPRQANTEPLELQSVKSEPPCN